MQSITKKYCFIFSLVLAVFAAPAFGAQAPLLPADNTGNLYVMVEGEGDDGNVNILEVAPDGTADILVSKAALYALVGLDPVEFQLSFDDGGIVTTEAGSIIFTLATGGDGDYGEYGSWIVERSDDGILTVIADNDDIMAETGEAYAEPEGLVIGYDGMLYCIDEISESLIQINPGTGDTSQFVTKTAFQGLIPTSDFQPDSGLSADEGYIYVTSDGVPKAVYRVNYSGNPEVFASGPGADPTSFAPAMVAIWLTQGPTPGGGFTLIFTPDDGVTELHTAPIYYDGDASDLQAAINSLGLPSIATVTGGDGTSIDPWIVSIDGGVIWDLYEGFVDLDGGTLEMRDLRKANQVNVADHIEAIGTASSTGEIVIYMEDYDEEVYGDMGSASWSVGDSDADVQTALEGADGIEPGDVTVTGAGTLADPWVITFIGNLSKHHIRITLTDFSGGEVDIPLLIGTMVNARAFADADAYLTRNESGSLMLNDDSRAHFLYEISASGDTSIFLSEWDLVLATGGSMDLEGGVAYDSDGNLYVGNDQASENYISPSAILKIAPDKTIESWLTGETVAALIGEDVDDINFAGIAFERLPESQGVCATLGDNAWHWALDTDIFTFEGEAGDEITITLSADESGSYTGKRATLILWDTIHGAFLFKRDKGKLPNSVSATLPANGTYVVKVLEQSKYARGEKFTGDYCLEMDSSMGAILEPTGWVE